MGILYEERANKEEKPVQYPYSLCMDEGAERHDNRRELGLGIRLGDWGSQERRCCACMLSCVVVLPEGVVNHGQTFVLPHTN